MLQLVAHHGDCEDLLSLPELNGVLDTLNSQGPDFQVGNSPPTLIECDQSPHILRHAFEWLEDWSPLGLLMWLRFPKVLLTSADNLGCKLQVLRCNVGIVRITQPVSTKVLEQCPANFTLRRLKLLFGFL